RARSALAGQRIRSATGRDEQLVVAQLAARVAGHGPVLEVDLRDRRLEAEVDAVLVVPLLVADLDPLLQQHALQVAGKRYAVVERVLLVVDHHDLARRVVLPQLFGRIGPGRAVADDHEAGGVRAQRDVLRNGVAALVLSAGADYAHSA